MRDAILNGLQQSLDLKQAMLADQTLHQALEQAVLLCKTALDDGRKILLCGNGGSAADCQHIAAELVGRFEKERPAMAAIALTTDTSALTAMVMIMVMRKCFPAKSPAWVTSATYDWLFDQWRQKNVVKAFEVAKQRGVKCVAMTGAKHGVMADMADVWLATPSTRTANIQEGHITLGHLLCALIEAD